MPKIISAGLAGTAAGTVSGLGLAQLVSGPADPKHPDHASPLRSAMKIGAANGLVATMMTGVGMAAAYQGLRSARVATALSGFAVLGAGAGIGVGGSIVIAQHGIAASRATSSS